MNESNPTSAIESIDVKVSAEAAYSQWTQFEEFPKFMEGVESVERTSDTTLRWKATVGGVTEEWTAQITDQTPAKRIAWKTIEGSRNAGVVTFQRLSDTTSRVALQIDYEHDGMGESIGEVLGLSTSRTATDLEGFKQFVEERARNRVPFAVRSHVRAAS